MLLARAIAPRRSHGQFYLSLARVRARSLARARARRRYNGVAPQNAATISGIVNGMGSLGSIVQGWLTPILIERIGWRGLFNLLGALLLAASLALIPAIAVEQRALPAAALG